MATLSNELPPLDRTPPREQKQQIPEPVPGAVGLFRVDATWGTIQSMEAAEGVRTVGELEVIEHLQWSAVRPVPMGDHRAPRGRVSGRPDPLLSGRPPRLDHPRAAHHPRNVRGLNSHEARTRRNRVAFGTSAW